MEDNDTRKRLADVVIGKEVPDRKGLRYVPQGPDGNLQDAVFEVEISTEKFSTNFGDWIEKDLLKLSTWDVKRVEMRDYSIDIVAQTMDPQNNITLEHQQSGEPAWKLVENQIFKDEKWVKKELAKDEELNTEKLNDLRNALGDLKIVDVERKPQAVSDDLRTEGELKLDAGTRTSLGQRGFYFVPVKPKVYDLLSTEGEARVVMNDGVVYTLRFGRTTGDSAAAPAKKAPGKDEAGKEKPENSGLNRYLFVMVEFGADVIPKPQLETLPADAKEATKPDAAAKKEEAKKEEAKKDEKPAEKPDATAKTDPKAERERIEKENKKKQDEYDEKVKKGKDRVKELNARFADWYFVISDSVYQKIHLAQSDVIRKKEEKKDLSKPAVDSPAELKELGASLPASKEEAPKTEPAPKMEAPVKEPSPAKADAPSKEEASKGEGSKPAAVKPEAGKPEAVKPEVKSDAAKPDPGPAPKAPECPRSRRPLNRRMRRSRDLTRGGQVSGRCLAPPFFIFQRTVLRLPQTPGERACRADLAGNRPGGRIRSCPSWWHSAAEPRAMPTTLGGGDGRWQTT